MSESTVFEVWLQRDAWAAEARAGKARQESARVLALALGVTGALLGTLAGLDPLALLPMVGDALPATLGVSSAVLIALGGYFGRELLTPERETEWARARILAEALKRECWRYLMSVPPYAGSDRAAQLRNRATSLVANMGLERGPVAADRDVEIPKIGGVEDYILKRPADQASYYERKSGEHRRAQLVYLRSTLALGSTAIVISVVGARFEPLLAFVPVMTTATAALIAWSQGNRVGALVSLYQETATQLRLQVAAWNDSSAERAKKPAAEQQQQAQEFVERCEGVMAQENGAWRAEWLSEEKAQQALGALERVTTEAKGGT